LISNNDSLIGGLLFVNINLSFLLASMTRIIYKNVQNGMTGK